jgi:hypothetical protein
MTKPVRTGVSPFGVVLALAILCLVPRIAAAESIHEFTVTPDGTLQTFEGAFEFDNDVALITFEIGEGLYDFTATTTSYADDSLDGFDPALWLYFAPLGSDPLDLSAYSLYTIPVEPVDPANPSFFTAQNDDEDFDNGVFDSLLSVKLVDAGTYILALSQTGNNAFEDTVFFDQSGDEFQCFTGTDEGLCFGGRNAAFAGTVQITNTDTTLVPEPGTLSLLALGSLSTAFLRRRRTRTNSTRT